MISLVHILSRLPFVSLQRAGKAAKYPTLPTGFVGQRQSSKANTIGESALLPSCPPALRNRQAFTLIELILYVAISSFVVVSMLNIFTVIVSSRQKTSVGSIAQQNLRFAMDRLTWTAHAALGINTGSSTFDSDTGVLSFTMTGGTALSPMIYSLCNGHLCAKIGTGPTMVVTGSGVLVDQFRITNLTAAGAPATVKLQLHGKETVTGASPQGTASFSLETSVSLRQ